MTSMRIPWMRTGRIALVLALLPLSQAGGADQEMLAGLDETRGGEPIEYRIVRWFIPELTEFTLVQLDTQGIAQQVASGAPVELPFAPQEDPGSIELVQMDLAPHDLPRASNKMRVLYRIDDGRVFQQFRDLPDPAEYSGVVSGTDNGLGGFIVRDDALLGAIMMPTPALEGTGWSFIEPVETMLKRNGARNGAVNRVLQSYNHVVYSTSAVDVSTILDDDDGEPDPGGDDTDGGSHERAPVVETASIYLISDTDHFLSRGGDLGLLDVDQIFPTLYVDIIMSIWEPGPWGSDNFDINLEIAEQSVWALGGPSSTVPELLLDEIWSIMNWGNEVNDYGFVHLFTGKNLDGSTIGKAWRIGGFDDPCTLFFLGGTCKQSLGQTNRPTTWEQIILLAHELGHVAGATHGKMASNYCYGNLCGPSIMQSFITASQSPFYSSGNSETIAPIVEIECAIDPC